MAVQPLIDTGAALAAARVTMPRSTASAADVAALRAAIARDVPAADTAARRWTQLGADLPPTTARVIGRMGWVRANLAALEGVLDPVAAKLTGRRRITSRLLGAQIGGLLGLLSGKVIGQFVLPLGKGGGFGELVVVGPNLLDLAEEHGALADDIRRIVIVHEITHRLQFDGVPWLADHLRGLLGSYLEDTKLDADALKGRMGALPDVLGEMREQGSIMPLTKIVLTPSQQEVMARAQGLMSLLEGHGNATMYRGSEGVVADPEAVRRALGSREPDVAARVLTAIAGLDMKRKQYSDGEAFVVAVVEDGGVETLNLAFAAAANLPGEGEIHDHEAWIARVGATSE